MQKTEKIFIGLLLAMVFIIPGVLAATTLNVPVTGTNYTTMTVNCTTGLNTSKLASNVSIYYNSSGGAADATSGTLLVSISNTTSHQAEFTSSPSIEALTAGTSYNFSCKADNGSTQQWSVGKTSVGIDNSNPTYTFVLSKPTRADYKASTQYLTWTTTDATSGVETVAVSVTSPNADTCPTQSWTSTSGTSQQIDLDCTGTYTASMTVTDNAGNSVTTTDPFNVYAPGYKTITSEDEQSFGTYSILGDNIAGGSNQKQIAIIAIIILVLWFLFKKK